MRLPMGIAFRFSGVGIITCLIMVEQIGNLEFRVNPAFG